MATFFFSRISLKFGGNYIDKSEILLKGITGSEEITFRKDDLKFLYGQLIKQGDKIFVTGEMVKYKPEHVEKIVSDKIEDYEIKNKFLGVVRFFIDPEASVIIYSEDRSHIPKKTFPKLFIELFSKNMGDEPVDIEIHAVTEEYSFIKRIAEVNLIKKIVISLTPSNPNFNDIWKDVDERLREDKITSYKEIQENKKPGESIVVDETTKKKFYMSEDGYGSSKVIGKDLQGKDITLSTEDAVRHAKWSIPNDIQDLVSQIERLREKLDEIIKRTQ